MEFLAKEREVLQNYLPDLELSLNEVPFIDLEKAGSPAIGIFKESGGGKVLIPTEYGGLGADPVEAIQIHRAIGSIAPSLAVAITMHNFSVATFVEMCQNSRGLEGLLLEGIARQNLLLASGFAEGHPNQEILSPTMHAERTKQGVVINGRKRPCSLSYSMDLLTASVLVQNDSNGKLETAIALISAKSQGLSRQKFWDSWILAGTESDEILLKDVLVEEDLLFPLFDQDQLDSTQISGFLWFELLITASYLGIASGLVERVLRANRGLVSEKAFLGVELEAAEAALECIALNLKNGLKDRDQLARMLFVRYSVQSAIEKTSTLAAEILGGMAFIRSSEVSYLYSASRALAFHPPSRSMAAPDLVDYLNGEAMQIR